ncbi:MAG: hypothetical protein NWR72_08735, partial [Bacteroidia bacterium]|nr:hypothetical protein [Bacteroidia bacterium]
MNAQALKNWAFHHPAHTRWILFGLHVIVGFSGSLLGLFVIGTGWYEAGWPLWVSLAALGGILFVRFLWKDQAPNRRAWVMIHLSSVLVIFTLNVYLGSRLPVQFGGDYTSSSLAAATAASAAPEVSAAEDPQVEEGSKKNWLTGFLHRARRNVEEMPVWLKILITLAIIAVVGFVLYIIPFLACAVACNDLGLLAIIVLIGGWGGAIYGGIVLGRVVWRSAEERKRRKQ